jgi:ABC-type transporter Mla subunit MlaD
MAARSTYFKLGLFTLLAIAMAVIVGVVLGIRVHEETVEYHTYFDESVQGLDVGAPVKYRGVPIGKVAKIAIAPDRRLVDVTLDLATRDWQKLKPAEPSPNLRARLAMQGITGVKFVDINFVHPDLSPPPKLDFAPAANYIPSAPSLTKRLEDNLQAILERLPELIDAAADTANEIRVVAQGFREQQIPENMGRAMRDIDAAARDVRVLVARVDRTQLPRHVGVGLERLTAAITEVDAMLQRVGGAHGLVASTQRAADTIGDLGRSTAGAADQLQRTLRELSGAAEAIRDLSEAVEREPDLLVKGRVQRRER